MARECVWNVLGGVAYVSMLLTDVGVRRASLAERMCLRCRVEKVARGGNLNVNR